MSPGPNECDAPDRVASSDPHATERSRLVAVDAYGLLELDGEETLDGLTAALAALLEVPIALVSVVDSDRQWFASRYGLDVRETPRAVAFCDHVVRDGQPLCVPDAHADDRFRENPLVTGAPHVRAYVSHPLTTPAGHVLGTLCGIDRVPRRFDATAQQQVRHLAQAVMSHLELKRRHRELESQRRQLEMYQQFFQQSHDLHCVAEASGRVLEVNRRWEDVLGWTVAELMQQRMLELVAEEDSDRTLQALSLIHI